MASPAGDSLEAALDELYRSDPADFVANRQRIAARLRADGARNEAKAVLTARRPSAAAAALNQLARERPEVITDFLERSTELRDSFRVSRDQVRTATAAHRDTLRVAIDAALALLGGRGHAYQAQVQSTLHAAGLDPDIAHLLRTGRLEKEVMGPSGFGESELPDLPAPDGAPPAPPERHLRLAPAPETVDTPPPGERQRVEAERAAHLAAAEVEAASATADLETARQTEHDLHGQLEAAKGHRAAAEARTQAARAVLAELQRQLEDESGQPNPS